MTSRASASIRSSSGNSTRSSANHGPNGEPSASDFLLVDLLTLSKVFTERFDEVPTLYPDRDDYRYLVASGLLVRAVTVTAQLAADGSIVVFGIDIDLTAWPE